MKKFVCSVCGYVHEGDSAPDFCPQCKAPKEKFVEQGGEMSWAAEHVVGVAQGVSRRHPGRPARQLQRRVHRSGYVPGYGPCCPSGRLS